VASRERGGVAILSLTFIAILWGIIAVKTIVFTKPAIKALDVIDAKDSEAIMAALAA